MSDFDDLLGLPDDGPTLSPYGNKIGRPKGSKNKSRGLRLPESDEEHRSRLNLKMQEVHNVASGVPITWLMEVFRMGRSQVQEALRDCPVLRTAQNGGKIYDIKTAAAYLVEPVTDLGTYLTTIDPKRLPQKFQEGYWNARIKEMKARVMAGDLWPTMKVLEVLGDTFQTIKSTVQLWADTVEEMKGEVTPEQRDALVALSDKLLDDIHRELVEKAKHQATESWAAELDAD